MRAIEILDHFDIRKYFVKIISRENYDPQEKGLQKDIGLVRQPGRLSLKSCIFSAYGLQKCVFKRKLFGNWRFPNNSIAQYGCDILIDDDIAEIEFNKERGKPGIAVEAYRKNKEMKEDELQGIILDYGL